MEMQLQEMLLFFSLFNVKALCKLQVGEDEQPVGQFLWGPESKFLHATTNEVKWKVGTSSTAAGMLNLESEDLHLNLHSATC